MMSEARARTKLASMPSNAQKVYEVTPISEAWTVAQVVAELTRTGQTLRDGRIVDGCLFALQRAGLVSRDTKNCVRREPVRPTRPKLAVVPLSTEEPAVSASTITPAAPAAPANPAPVAVSAIDTLTKLSTKVRGMAKMLTDMADEIDETAVEVEEAIERAGTEVAELKELKTLLKRLGN